MCSVWRFVGILVVCMLILLFATAGFTKLSFHLGWFNGEGNRNIPEPTTYKTGLMKDVENYILRGPRSRLKQMEFKEILYPDQLQLKSIELSNVIIDPQILLNSLENCKHLESLKLYNVILKSHSGQGSSHYPYSMDNNIGFQTHIYLPRLKKFIFDLESESEELQLTIPDFQSIEKFKTLLPFHGLWEKEFIYKNNSGTFTYYRENDVSSKLHVFSSSSSLRSHHQEKMQLNIIDIRINNIKLLQFNRMDGLLLSFLNFNNDILEHLHKENVYLRRLYLLDSTNIKISNIPTQLIAIFIRQVNKLPNLNDLLEKLRTFVYLDELRIFLSNYEDIIDLATIPRHIKHLALGNGTLVASSLLSSQNLNLHFPNLEKLGLTLPFIDDVILKNFQYIFPLCKQIVLEFSYSTTSEYEERKLLSIAMGLPNIEVIIVRYFYSRHGRSSIHDPSIEFSEIESLLDRFGIPRDSIYFLLLREDGRWRGHGLTSDDSKYLAGALSAKPYDFAATEFEFTLNS